MAGSFMATSGGISGILSFGHEGVRVSIVNRGTSIKNPILDEALDLDGEEFVNLTVVVEAILRRVNTKDAYNRLTKALARLGEEHKEPEDWEERVVEKVEKAEKADADAAARAADIKPTGYGNCTSRFPGETDVRCMRDYGHPGHHLNGSYYWDNNGTVFPK